MKFVQSIKVRLEHVVDLDSPQLFVSERLPRQRSHVCLDVVIYDYLYGIENIVADIRLNILEISQSHKILQEFAPKQACFLLYTASLLHV